MFMIQAGNLFFSYTSSPPYVLSDISLEISDSDYISMVGENGCGKSTLMRLVLKFIKPTGGIIESKAKRIKYVPQKNDFSDANFPITVSKMLRSYCKLLKIKDKNVIVSGIAQVGMNGFESALVGTLSDGQRQKTLTARALLGNPDPLILDKPSTGVDMGNQKEIYGFLRKLNREKRVTIISVEHNLNATITNLTSLYHLAAGRGHLCTPEQYTKEYPHGEKKDESNAQL